MLKMPSRLRDLLPFHDRAITQMTAVKGLSTSLHHYLTEAILPDALRIRCRHVRWADTAQIHS